jgi:hypothetical protein
MHRYFPNQTFKTSGFLALLSALLLCAWALAAEASEQKKSSGGGYGGGVGISIDLTPLLNQPSKPNPRKPQPRRPACYKPLVYYKGRCVCPTSAGYVSINGRCVPRRPPTEVVKTPPVDVTRIQECLQKANFDPGPVDGAAGRQTIDAFRRFQQANGLGNRPASLSDKESTGHLFRICEAPQSPVPTRRAAAPAVQPANCIPQDLHDMLTASYGSRPGVNACPNACLPKPESFSDARIQSVQAQFGVNWCSNCVRFSGWLPLPEILNIEKLAGITMCATPLSQCVLPASLTSISNGNYPKVRTIFKTLPTSIRKDGDIAVIIGNESYENLPANTNGLRDASAVRTLLEEHLGYLPEKIIDLRDANLAEIEDLFGTPSNEGFLAKQLADKNKGDVFIYVASHGMASEEQNRGYIMPVDAKFDKTGKGSYALQQLYDSLGRLGARTIMLALEVTFNTELHHLIDPPNLPQLASSVLPETAVPGLAVFTASDRDQTTLEDPEYGIGLFTRYLIEGLAGQADEQPIGNADKLIDTVELYVYTANLVRQAARKTQGLEQKPLLAKHDNLLIGRLGQR